MSGRPALVRERDVKAVIRAARKAGAPEIQLHLGGSVSVVIPLRANAIAKPSMSPRVRMRYENKWRTIWQAARCHCDLGQILEVGFP